MAKNALTYSFDVEARHEGAEDGEVLVHLLSAVSLHGDVRDSVLTFFHLRSGGGGGVGQLPTLGGGGGGGVGVGIPRSGGGGGA